MPTLLRQISRAGANHPGLARNVIRQPSLLPELMEGLNAPTARIKFGSAKVLRLIGQAQPGLLYPHFDFFVRLLSQENKILQWEAIVILSHLAGVDQENKFAAVFKSYFAPIKGPVLVTAANVIGSAARIAQAKPHWAQRIAGEVLKVSRARYRTPECRKVAIGQAIDCFDQIFDLLEEKQSVVQFVRRQLRNTRAPTRKKAERFLRKHRLSWKTSICRP